MVRISGAGALVGILLTLGLPGRPSAQPPVRDLDPDTEAAQLKFRKGAEFYLASDYEKALIEFQAARAIKPLAAMDFNLARCFDRLARYAEAVASYRRFLAAVPPESDDAKEARDRVRLLEARMAAIQQATAPPTPVPALERRAPVAAPPAARPPAPSPLPVAGEPSSARRFAAPLAVGAVALALVGVGAGMLGWVRSDLAALDAKGCAPACDPQLKDPLHLHADLGYAFLAAGGAAAAVDVVLWALAARRPLPSERRVQLAPGPAGVYARGTF